MISFTISTIIITNTTDTTIIITTTQQSPSVVLLFYLEKLFCLQVWLFQAKLTISVIIFTSFYFFFLGLPSSLTRDLQTYALYWGKL